MAFTEGITDADRRATTCGPHGRRAWRQVRFYILALNRLKIHRTFVSTPAARALGPREESEGPRSRGRKGPGRRCERRLPAVRPPYTGLGPRHCSNTQ